MINDKVVSYLKMDGIDRNAIYKARSGIYEIQSLYSFIDSICIFRNDGMYISTGYGEYNINFDGFDRDEVLNARGSVVLSINGKA
jgi:hypothetical protein